MLPKYKNMPKAKRFEEGVRLHLAEGYSQGEAAKAVGVSRQQLNLHCQKARKAQEERVAAAKERMASGGGALGLNERRRVPPFEEFERMYFGHLECPDCGVRHDMPGFHKEIVDALESDARRILVNIPPYHAKSTLVTVKHTVYDIVRNPNVRTIVVSKSEPMANRFVSAVANILTNPDLYIGANHDLIADWGPFRKTEGRGDQKWSAGSFFVAGRVSAEKDPTVLALGVGQQIYGARADKIKFDDIATLENSRNPERIAALLEWIDKEALSRIGKSGKAIWVGTRVSAGDIYSILGNRNGYRVVRYPCIVDDSSELTLWPEHFPYEQALIHRSEMKPADFQLIYQNVDVPGLGASFTPEMIDACKDQQRVVGHFEPHWRLIAGLDPAGGNKDSGFTAMTLVGVDPGTGMRYVIDQTAVKSMKAPEMKAQILEWSDRYPLSEWRVEVNGVQSQLVQYDRELVAKLAQRGVRVVPHTTHRNKWDPQFGVESMAPLFEAQLVSIPWGNAPSARVMQPLLEELVGFPMAVTQDRVMSLWFTHIGAKEFMERQTMPLFDRRMRVPKRIARNRRVVDFDRREVRNVPLRTQQPGRVSAMRGYRRNVFASPGDAVREFEFDPGTPVPVNVDPAIWAERDRSRDDGDGDAEGSAGLPA